MADLTTFPLQDNYQSTLAQAWNGATGSVYVNSVPSFTFPAWKKCYIVVDPEKNNMQVARISAYDATAKTFTVDSIAVNKGNWVAYTQQSHAVGSKVMISDNYQFREDLATAIDSKVDTNSNDTTMGKFADATARDAYFTSPVEWNTAFVTWVWRTDYIGWSRQTRTSSANASNTQKWLVEKATSWEVTAWTATGWTGAELFVWPAELKTVADSKPNTATNTEAQAGSSTSLAVSPYQLRNFAWPTPTAWTVFNAFPPVTNLTTNSTAYIKKAEATVTRDGVYRISFTGSNNFYFWYTTIYKNWVTYWLERVRWASPTTRVEDLSFSAWDKIQLYMRSSDPAWTSTCSNYSVQYNAYIMTNTTY